jgi:hypothetical protein
MLNLEEDNVGVVLLGPSVGIKEVRLKQYPFLKLESKW